MESDLVRQDFDRLAVFDDGSWNHNTAYHRFILSHLPVSADSCLDVGCGTGAFAREAAVRCKLVTAVDLSPQMVACARKHSGAFRNIAYLAADALALPFQEQFDCVVSIATLHHCDLAMALERLASYLKPGGVMVIIDLYQPATLVDYAVCGIAMVVSPLLRACNGVKRRDDPAVRQAWAEHSAHEAYLTLRQVRQVCSAVLAGAKVRRHLLYRYSVIWQKPPDGGNSTRRM